MYRLIHSFLLMVSLVILGVGSAHAASVPITVDDNLGGLIPGTERNTCNPDFMEVLENRAWEEAQREITQNANLIARPDSVLSMTCFDSWLDDLADYAESNFPGDPDESDGRLLNGLLTDLTIVLIDDIISGIDPNLTEGYVLYALLEILVLDQLEDVNSITGQIQDGISLAGCIPLLGSNPKQRYINDNYPGLMIGNRAKNQTGPTYAQISSGLDNSVSDSSNYNGCALMNQVWQRTKCYDFATEAPHPPGVPLPPSAAAGHDRFYTLQQYEANAAAGRDFRTEANQCDPPDNNLVELPSVSEFACQVMAHGLPSPPAWAGFITGFSLTGGFSAPGGGPTWTQAFNAANPLPGAPGATDLYTHYLNLVTGVCTAGPGVTCPATPIVTTCAPPIKVGYLVNRGSKRYVDAVCPNPGCFFTAPANIAGNGTCTPKP